MTKKEQRALQARVKELEDWTEKQQYIIHTIRGATGLEFHDGHSLTEEVQRLKHFEMTHSDVLRDAIRKEAMLVAKINFLCKKILNLSKALCFAAQACDTGEVPER